MTAPRHLWSGDWRRESAAAAEELARGRALTEEPSPPPPPSPPKPPSAAARALAQMRSLRSRGAVQMRTLRSRGAVVTVVAMLLSGGIAYAAVASLRSEGGGSSGTGHARVTGSPARTAAPGWLGVDTVNFPSAVGVMVVDVVPGSPADLAGLQPGDVITQIGDRPVRAPSDLESALAGMHAGQRVEIQYERGTDSYTTQATLRARPANGP